MLGAAALQPINVALRNGASQNLQGVWLLKITLGESDLREFADALGKSESAKRLETFTLWCSIYSVEGMRILAGFLFQAAFPALNIFYLIGIGNPNGTDAGVMASTETLKARQTSLANLALYNVEMGDEGIAALASLVSHGRMEQLEELDISLNAALTQQGIITLARAIDARGLPMLETLEMSRLTNLTAVGIGGIALAVIKGCPRLKVIDFWGSGQEDSSHRDAVTGMLDAVGRAGKVKVIYDE